MMKSKDIEVRAIASRTLPTAKKWAKKLGIPGRLRLVRGAPRRSRDRGDLQSASQPPARAADARRGGQGQARALREADRADGRGGGDSSGRRRGGILIAEAFMVRHHPQWLKARELAQKGKLGTLRAIQCFFSYHNVDPKNVRNMADIGGGARLRHRLLPDRHRPLHLRRRAAAGRRADRPRSRLPHRPDDQRRARLRRGAAPHLHGRRRRRSPISGSRSSAPRDGSRSRSRSTRRRAAP